MEISQKISAAVERMPAFPKSVQSILELTRKIDVDAKAIVQVIEKDPVMTMKILRIINSAFYALPRQVSSVNHAVVMLGINTVKNMALTLAAAGMLPARNSAGFDTSQYLLHSLAVAGTSRLLAQKFADTDVHEAYIAGLLHDFGKIIFAQFFPEEFRTALDQAAQGIPLHVAEQEALGSDHTIAGSLLVEKWQFPPTLVAAIKEHHNPAEHDSGLGRCLFLADELAHHLGVGFAGNGVVAELPPGLAGPLGTSWDELAGNLPELAHIYNEARSFAQEGLQP
jgi:putative nucleotidyltransferase with HDIG domain